MQPVARPGETCWRLAHARRAALIIDNEAYFAAVAEALERARRSVLILGWQLDTRTELRRGQAAPAGRGRLGELLRSLARERPGLDLRLLVWDMALPISATRGFYPQRARLDLDGAAHLHLDGRHPPGACHHQKLVVVDDAVAFCSGADFSSNRWDSAAHLEDDPRRRLPSGRRHSPRHAVSAAVDGAAAAALGELARARWARATGERLAAPEAGEADPWPETLRADFEDCPVAIARTQPEYEEEPAIRENEALYLAAIGAARRFIYLENQYLTAPRIADALAARLAEPGGPEVVAVLPSRSPNYFDRLTMDAPRDAMIARLQAADRHGRFRAFSPAAVGGEPIVVHSKVMIVDDRLLRTGSANLSNRSMGLDTECDVAIDAARSPACAPRIAAWLRRLIGHHVQAAPQEVEREMARLGGLGAAIESLGRPGANRLRPLRPGARRARSLVARWHLGDPQGAGDSFRPWRRRA